MSGDSLRIGKSLMRMRIDRLIARSNNSVAGAHAERAIELFHLSKMSNKLGLSLPVGNFGHIDGLFAL
jgi:hypothetical protein